MDIETIGGESQDSYQVSALFVWSIASPALEHQDQTNLLGLWLTYLFQFWIPHHI